jgi:hypothetical protein
VKRDIVRSNSPSNEDLESHKDTNKSTSEIDSTDSSDGESLVTHPFRKCGREKKQQAPIEDNGIVIQIRGTIGFTNDDGDEVEVIGNENVLISHCLNDGKDCARNFFKDDIGHKDVDISGGAFEVVVSDEE